MTHYVLPFGPSTNTYYRHVGARVLISKAGRQYREAVWAAVREQDLAKHSGRLELRVTLTMPDRRRRDLDNFAGKALLDALAYAGVYDDDSQIDKLTIERGGVEAPGAVLVTVLERETAPVRFALDRCS